jgi:hypothetical protein
MGLILLIAAVFVLLGLWMGGLFGPIPETRRYPAHASVVIGWFNVIFFGLAGIIALPRLFDAGEQLRISPAGIRYRQWSDRTIPWSAIADVTVWSYKGQSSIILHLRDPAQYPARGLTALTGWFNKMVADGDVAIGLSTTDRTVADAMDAIERFWPQAGEAALSR